MHRILLYVLVTGAFACGPTVEPTIDQDTGAPTSSSGAADESSTGPGADGATSADSSPSSDGSSGETTAGSTGAAPGDGWVPMLIGQWECIGFEDPLFLDIEAVVVEPPAVTGRACGVVIDATHPLEGTNCGALEVHPLPWIAFRWTLPYDDFPDFGPLVMDMLGGYDPETDRIEGVMWTNDDNTNQRPITCERVRL